MQSVLNFEDFRSLVGEGFGYVQKDGRELVRFPTRSDPISAALLLISFAGYPRINLMRQRSDALEAGFAWVLRRAREAGARLGVHPGLSSRDMAARRIQNRFYKCCRRFEGDAMDVADIVGRLSFERSGMASQIAHALGAVVAADSVTVNTPRGYGSSLPAIRAMLHERKSVAALDSIETAQNNYKSRVYSTFLPAAPLMLSLDRFVLKRDVITGRPGIDIPGYESRYLAICLLWNPQLWVEQVITGAEIWRQLLIPHFGDRAFPLLAPEAGCC